MAFYDNKPSKLEAVGNGSYLYRWNIQKVKPESVEQTSEEGAEAQAEKAPQFSCEEVSVWEPLTSNKITEAVITSKWDANYEQKLVNEFNAAQLGLYGAKTSDEAKARIKTYTDYLTERAALKTQVDADCAEFGIL
jgi:hypothetical protein